MDILILENWMITRKYENFNYYSKFKFRKNYRKTINSVISQDHKNIEYIIIDGESNDNTLKIANEYKNNITKIISEKDKGIYDGINKGIQIATGDVISLIHSNDIFVDTNVISKINDILKKILILILF